jgi:hypothetical protein
LISSGGGRHGPCRSAETLADLINVASQADDLEEVYKILREMRGVIDNALPPKPATPHIRSVK